MARDRQQLKEEIRSGTEVVNQVQSGVAEMTEKMEKFYEEMMAQMKEQHEKTIRENNENQKREDEEKQKAH